MVNSMVMYFLKKSKFDFILIKHMNVMFSLPEIFTSVNMNNIRYAVFCPGFQKGRVPSEKGTLAW